MSLKNSLYSIFSPYGLSLSNYWAIIKL
uniref:Uncharacterized protein n=1 Tax=Rhizophora mucronata TaxID=61149 RepID=A0A2P2Q2F4_RHIMU